MEMATVDREEYIEHLNAHPQGQGRCDHHMATLLPHFNPLTDLIFPVEGHRPPGQTFVKARFKCPICKKYHEHGGFDDLQVGVPEGKFAHCDKSVSPLPCAAGVLREWLSTH